MLAIHSRASNMRGRPTQPHNMCTHQVLHLYTYAEILIYARDALQWPIPVALTRAPCGRYLMSISNLSLESVPHADLKNVYFLLQLLATTFRKVDFSKWNLRWDLRWKIVQNKISYISARNATRVNSNELVFISFTKKHTEQKGLVQRNKW